MTDNASWQTNLTFTDSETFNTTFETTETFATTMDEVVQVTTSDHRKLTHRDAESQHPISAISNLSTELQNRVVAGNALTNTDIEELLGGD